MLYTSISCGPLKRLLPQGSIVEVTEHTKEGSDITATHAGGTERTNTPLAGLGTPTYIVIMAIASIAIVEGKQEKTVERWISRIVPHCGEFVVVVTPHNVTLFDTVSRNKG